MGTRVLFWLGKRDGLESLLLENAASFQSWFSPIAEDLVNRPSECRQVLTSVLKDGIPALLASDPESATVADELVGSFVGDFCDYGPGENLLRSLDVGWINVFNYAIESEYVAQHGSEPCKALWSAILNGRPLGRERPSFVSPDDNFRFGWFTYDECIAMVDDIRLLAEARGRRPPTMQAPSWLKFFGSLLRKTNGTPNSTSLEMASDAIAECCRAGTGMIITTS